MVRSLASRVFAPGLLADPDFRNLWLATTISHFGSHVTALALPLVAILLLGAGPGEIGVLFAVEMLPFLLIGLPAGVWVDRMRRRPMLIVADIGRGLLLASIPVAAVLDALTMIQLYLVGFGVGVFSVFFEVAYTSYLPSLAERDRLVEGNAKLEASRSVASVGGPGLAGLLVDVLGAAVAMLADSVSFVASALFVWLIRRPEHPPQRSADSPGMRAELVAGLRWIGAHPVLRVVLAANTLANVFLAMFQTLFVLHLVDGLGLGAAVIGVVFTVANVGGLVGALVASRVARVLGVGRTLAMALAGEGVGYALVALAPREAPIPLLLVAATFLQFMSVVFSINAVSLRQTVTPHALLGRMSATYRFASWGVTPLGATAAGILGSAIGTGPSLLVAAGGALVSILPIVLSHVGRLHVLPAAPPDPAASAITP